MKIANALVDLAMKEFGGLDAAFNNAAVSGRCALAETALGGGNGTPSRFPSLKAWTGTLRPVRRACIEDFRCARICVEQQRGQNEEKPGCLNGALAEMSK